MNGNERNLNVDKIRGIACLLVLLYHCYALTGKLPIGIPVIKDLIIKGGCIGVTIFFVLSGYGIYLSLQEMEKRNSLNFASFIKKRFVRIAPHYYFNIFALLILSSSVVYLSKEHWRSILWHIFFIHSWSFETHGSINGALWTMSVIFQFYLFAIPLYKIVREKNHFWVLGGVIAFTIVFKWIMINYLWITDESVYGTFAFMIPTRQFVTSIDNFVIGMVAAKVVNYRKGDNQDIFRKKVICGLSFIYIIVLTEIAMKHNIYEKSILGYCWFSFLAIGIGILLVACDFDSKTTLLGRFSIFISKHEYAIYLWHLPILYNLTSGNSAFVNYLLDFSSGLPFYLFSMCVCICFAIVVERIFYIKR